MKHVLFATLLLLGSGPLSAEVTLPTHPGPANNNGSFSWGMFLDLKGKPGAQVTGLTTASDAPANSTFVLEVFTRNGTALGGGVGSGPGSSMAGWTQHAIVTATQGPQSGGVSLPIKLPPIRIGAGQTVGVALVFHDAGPAYFGTGAAPLQTYSDAGISAVTGDVRSGPFVPGGVFHSSRSLVGSVTYEFTLPTHPGPASNNGGVGYAMLLDATAATDVVLNRLVTPTRALADTSYAIEVFSREGTALGGPLGSGPGSSPAGWTSRGVAHATQGPLTDGLSQPIILPDVPVRAGQTTGIALVFSDVRPLYFGNGVVPLETFTDPHLSIVTGDVRSQPFTTSGSFFSSRALVGSVGYGLGPRIRLILNPGPANNIAAVGSAQLLDITAIKPVVVSGLTTASTADAGTSFTIAVYTRTGSALGGPVGAGPGSSPAGWTFRGVATATQGNAPFGLSLPVSLPAMAIRAGETLGVALIYGGAGPAFFGEGAPPLSVFGDANIQVTSGDVRQFLFTQTGAYLSSREFVGAFLYSPVLFRDGFD